MRSKAEIEIEFAALVCDLSPENLTCDGELSAAQVRRRLSMIKKRWRELEKEYGKMVSEDEAYRFLFTRKPFP